MNPIKVIATGACGRMCGLVLKSVLEQKDMQLVAAVDVAGTPHEGRDVGIVLGLGEVGVSVSGVDKLPSLINKLKPDVLVDFTIAEAAVKTADMAAENGLNIVVGTTGFSPEQLNRIGDAVKSRKISAVVYPNMSVGVNILFKMAEVFSGMMKDYDIEITEAHHRNKLDSPSGTALKLGEIISRQTGKKLMYGRGKEMRKRGDEIAIHAIRAGDIVGDHTVIFACPGERLELTHKASSRQAFASGTVKAIRFVAGKKDGKVHGMDDVLGLNSKRF